MSRPRDEIREPLGRVLRWMLGLRDGAGRIVCPEHGVEHTGKSAYAAVLAARLARWEGDAELARAAAQQGERLVANLVREGTSPCHTFRPGRHDPFNCSNSVIDGGACSDALAALVRELGPDLEPAVRERFAQASLLHARTYLRYAVLDKGIPAQRAWGLTGLAGAWTLERDPELAGAAREAVAILADVQRGDGSFPYHPVQWGAEHPGSSDASAFYQSRVTGFTAYALELLGEDPRAEPYAGSLRRGAEFLAALHGPDGTKVGLVEAKPWYWGATYEVASHPFDVHALTRAWRLFGDDEHGRVAARAFRTWAEHLADDGSPRSHRPGPGRGRSYQCPLFWAAHAAWLARAAEDLDAALDLPEAPSPPAGRVQVFRDASLARLEDERVVAWVRGRRPGCNVLHGSPHGAGLLRCVRRADGRELVPRCRLGGAQAGEWTGHSGLPSPARGLRAGARAVRFSLWLSRVDWRAGRRGRALRGPLAMTSRGVLAFAHSRVGSPFALDAELTPLEGGVRVEAPWAWRDGSAVPGTRLVREFRVDGQGLLVVDASPESGPVRGVRFRVPPAAQEVAGGGREVRYRLA